MANILNDLDMWEGETEVSDKHPDTADQPVAFLPRDYESMLGENKTIPVKNPKTGETFNFPVQFTDDEDQKRIRLSPAAMAKGQFEPTQPAILDFNPRRPSVPDDDGSAPPTGEGGLRLRSMAYGPIENEYTKATLYGPAGNKLTPRDVAVSPDVEKQFPMGSFIQDSKGTVLRVADRSFIKPGQPTHGVVERRDVHDLGHETYSAVDPEKAKGLFKEQLDKTIAGTSDRALLAGDQPTRASIQNATLDTEALKKAEKTMGEDGFVHYHDAQNTRVNTKTGLIMQDIGGRTVVHQKIGKGKYQTHWLPKDDNPRDALIKKAAEQGVERGDYPEGPEGDKQFNDDAKASLGAGVAEDIADGIEQGNLSPILSGNSRHTPRVRAILAKRGYNQRDAELDYKATTRHMAAMNGPQQLRLRQAVDTTKHSVDMIDELAKEWKAGNYPALNKVRMASAKQGALGPDAQRLAVQLEAQIADITSEMANVLMGGNSPTDHSMDLAAANLNKDWSEPTLLAMTQQLRRNLQYRENAMKSAGAAGLINPTAEAKSAEAKEVAAAPSATPTPAPATKRIKGHYYTNSKGEDLGMWDGTQFVK